MLADDSRSFETNVGLHVCLLRVPLELHDVLPQMNVVDYISFNIATIRDNLKGHCIEFKYYADGIHSGLTPQG